MCVVVEIMQPLDDKLSPYLGVFFKQFQLNFEMIHSKCLKIDTLIHTTKQIGTYRANYFMCCHRKPSKIEPN